VTILMAIMETISPENRKINVVERKLANNYFFFNTTTTNHIG
jgi:hypothetical protein